MASLLKKDLAESWHRDRSAFNAARIRRLIKRETPNLPDNAPSVRAAFIGSFTLDTIRDTFEIACLDEGIIPHTFLGAYQQYPQEMLNPASGLYGHSPEVTYLALDPEAVFRDFCYAPPVNAAELEKALEDFLTRLRAMVRQFENQDAGLLVIHNLAVPPYDVLGNHALQRGSLTWAVRLFNERLLALSQEHPRVQVLDYDHVAARVGKALAHNAKLRLFGRFCVSHEAVPALVHAQIGYVKALKGLTRKCIVLDLDNTLWGGIVGEDGYEGIHLGPTPPGNAYWEFQKTLLGYYRRGIILAINSRNNPDDALRVIREHPYQVLREEHFGSMVINWGDKASNLKTLAADLNIGVDDLVFIDDDQRNCELVGMAMPEVLVVNLPEDPSLFSQTLLALNDFESLTLTEEDRTRGAMYAAERSRRAAKGSTADLEEFLDHLQTRIHIADADAFAVPRIFQLTQRTNQFNMTTRRYTLAEIQELAARPDTRVLYITASDKYGDSGIVGVAVIVKQGPVWHMDTLLMSCRILGRHIEDAFLWWIASQAVGAGAKELRGDVIYTKKNAAARGFYERMGFHVIQESEAGKIYAADAAQVASRKPRGVHFE
jgi:FkbH-like protein